MSDGKKFLVATGLSAVSCFLFTSFSLADAGHEGGYLIIGVLVISVLIAVLNQSYFLPAGWAGVKYSLPTVAFSMILIGIATLTEAGLELNTFTIALYAPLLINSLVGLYFFQSGRSSQQ